MKGMIFNIQRFCLHDGPGIRTTVFFKGCSLNCAWCHNPESHKSCPELLYSPANCIRCGACAQVCPEKLHSISGSGHSFDRALCRACGACAAVCPTGALELSGKEADADEVFAQVLRDAEFYRAGSGGLTLSGGEPMAQPAFALELARKAREAGIHVCVETCGYCDRGDLKKMLPYTDLFLYDFKLADSEAHKRWTGADNAMILDNLAFLNESGAGIVLRCPIIPGVNFTDGHFDSIERVSQLYPAVRQIDLEPYHPLGIQKSMRLGRAAGFELDGFLERDRLEVYARRLGSRVPIQVNII
ncbi:MAG: glycyl-radical enzyme activating protein [Clostridia bacterium]|nr:glycyl-radical enzyme activating protein [Clostridia bacterium]